MDDHGAGTLYSTKTLENHALAMAELAVGIALQHFRKPLEIEFKSDDSPVTHADKAIERAVREYLQEHLPGHSVFGEEMGQHGSVSESLWIIDPIDGTRSFLSGHPLFGFLLAYLEGGSPKLGLVGVPALGEVYIGSHDGGAKRNGSIIYVSRQTDLAAAVLYVNEGDKLYAQHPALFERLMQSGQTRRFAYDCYPHALLASGHVDAVIDFDLQPYDYLATSVLVEAAGGIVTDWSGNPLNMQSDGRVIAAATPELHTALQELVIKLT